MHKCNIHDSHVCHLCIYDISIKTFECVTCNKTEFYVVDKATTLECVICRL